METNFYQTNGKKAPFFTKAKIVEGNVIIEIPFKDDKTAENFINTFCTI